MLKGDIRKQEILDTSEKLFCQYGYEKASVQDVLDILKLSKGSFYHHFESKAQILEKICVRHANGMAERTGKSIEKKDPSAVGRINELLSGMIPVTGDGMTFLKMLLPVFSLPEGRTVRAAFREALLDAFLPMTQEALEKASEEDAILCRESEINARICLGLVNDLWCGICDQILADRNGEQTEEKIGEALQVTAQYRSAIESILIMPYGSLELISFPELRKLWTELTSC